MYSTCLFCNGALGRNEVLETFPVGRRIAFDPAKGRLWVICRKCERWNLSPLEERWEAFEACERLFRSTRIRMSTDQIGLARLREGLELVRIGEPLRPEFAAWRYGDQFGRRRRRTMLWAGAGIAAIAALSAGAIAVGAGAGGIGPLWNALMNIPVRARIRASDGRVLKVRSSHLRSARLGRDPESGEWVTRLRVGLFTETLRGDEAVKAVGLLLPGVNLMAGSPAVIQQAVDHIEAAGNPEGYLAKLAPTLPPFDPDRNAHQSTPMIATSKGQLLRKLPTPTRLALEMALHEEQERRALAGELVDLELAWRQAEEIAAIADGLLVPPEHEAVIARERARLGDGPVENR